MLTLELVNHCWKYWRLATLHLSQLALHPPQACRVTCTIVHAPAADDPATAAVLDYFGGLQIENVRWNFMELPQPELCRRAIGRNRACLASKADFVLLGDIDYCFGPGALDAAAAEMHKTHTAGGPALMFPREILQSRDHACGDEEIARVDRPKILDLTPASYAPVQTRLGIGGHQYIPGKFARERGYLSNSRIFQRPVDTWQRTRCDVAFRQWAGLRSVRLGIPGIRRIRHSVRGRTDIGVEL